jgi:tetratricopeptide (TPR) repeat protein
MSQDCTTVTRLANVLLDRYRQTADMGDLLEAKSTMEAAMELPELDDDFFEATESLSTALIENNSATHDIEPLMAAIDFQRIVVERVPSSNAHHHVVVLRLGELLFSRSAVKNTKEDSEEGASLYLSILGDSTLSTGNRVIVLANLSAHYAESWEMFHREEDLDIALAYGTECVELCPPIHPHWADLQMNYAMTLWACSKRDDDGARHQEAMQIMENLTQNHANRVHDGTRMNYASLLDHGYRRTGDLSLLERSIGILRPIVQNTNSASPMRGMLCVNLGNGLQRYYDRTSDRQSVIDAHQYYVEALDHFPQGHPLRGQIIVSIQTALEDMDKLDLPRDTSLFNPDQMGVGDAISYFQRCRYLQGGRWLPKILPGLIYTIKKAISDFVESDSLKLLELLMELLEQSLSVCTIQDPRRLWLLQQKGDMQYIHFTRTESLPSLHAAILAYEEFIERSPVEDEGLLSCMSNLAQCLDERSQRGAKEDDLQASIAMHRRVMERALAGHPRHVDAIIAITTTLDHMVERLQDVEAGEEAIRLYQYLLESCELSSGQQVLAKGHYGLALINRYQSTDELAALDEAITMLREVLTLIKPDSASAKQQRAAFLHNLGIAVHMRYERAGDMDSLDEAIQLYEELLNLLHPLDPMRSVALLALGNGYLDRGSQRQDMDELVVARRNYEEALTLRPPGHPGRHAALHSLSRALHILWQSQLDPKLLLQEMEYVREGLQLSPYTNVFMYISGLKRLAEMDLILFDLVKDTNLLDEAMRALQQAVGLLLPGHRLRGPVFLDLAMTHWRRFLTMRNEEDLQESKRCVEEAVRLVSKDSHSMYECTELRFRHALEEGDVLGRPDIPAGLRIGTEYLCNEDIDIYSRITFALGALKFLPSIVEEGAQSQLLAFYTKCIEYLPRWLAASEATPTTRYQLLEGQSTGDVGRSAFMLALKLGAPHEALRLLETCRAAFWSQALWTRVQLDGLPADVSEELRLIFQSLEAPHKSAKKMSTKLSTVWEGGPATEKRRRQRRRLEELATSIRKLPGHDRFMLTPTYERLRKAAAGNIIVILAHDATGSAALVLRGDGHDVLHVSFPEVPEERLHMLARDVKDCYMQVRGGQDEDRLGLGVKNREKPKANVFAKLWIAVVQPVFHALDLKVLFLIRVSIIVDLR